MGAAEAILPRAQARMRRLDMRFVAGIVLMLVAIVGGSGVVRAGRARIPVVIAAAEVQPGEAISESDLGTAEIAVASGITTLAASAKETLIGRIAAEPMWPGKILSAQSFSDLPPLGKGEVAMSVALGVEHAAAGALRSGDRVAVVGSNKNGEIASAAVLFTDVAVLAVREASTVAGEGGDLIITLRLRLEQARALAAAIAAGDINLVQLGSAR